MGEIFRREAAEAPEPFTGERLTAAIGGQVQIEHYHRYLFARALACGKDVLDVASGEGYGSALLAQVARSVCGVEYSGATARNAALNFPRPNLRFVQGDARALPLADASVDLVVSFETIEHFDRQDDFVREAHRVLRAAGCFIVSTPDRDVYSPLGSPANPFHVHELSRPEFIALLRDSFQHVALLQQRPMHGSALLAEAGSEATALAFERRGETHFEVNAGLARAPYLVAVASDAPLSPLPPSVYIDRSDLDTDRVRAVQLAGELRQAQAENGEARRSLDAARAQVDELQAELARVQAECTAARGEARRTQEALAVALAEIQTSAQRLQQATDRAHRAEAAVSEAAQHLAQLRGSARTFLRGYLPLLSRHLRGK